MNQKENNLSHMEFLLCQAYDIAKQMKQDYYTMLTERRPDVYIA
jgi:hypothetical protein